ncbi:dual specificity protein phosphatase 12 family member [Holotrichia oblita]|uniref:Dual specificity protein phosphatase 12 family member n=1 Tax=Holotrichia oblita TaxID=644536 RepID=A0ACB9THT0_HOLOL|nr:dual specificity protein phosphatase 12 family member [Holotrichia oblita]
MGTCKSKTYHDEYRNHISIDIIEKNLYLGGLSAARDIKTLKCYKITHILTIDTSPLPNYITTKLKQLNTKFIRLSDYPKEDLLSHLDSCISFINDGVYKGKVLVHCFCGISRSASVIIAYMMRKYSLSYDEALRTVKSKRGIVFPNYGFICQLKLYEEMGFRIDVKNIQYKLLRLSAAGDKIRQNKMLPIDYFDVIKPDTGENPIQFESNVYKCRECKRILASETNLIPHQDQSTNQICNKTYSLEPLTWMNVRQSRQGKLNCPKCNCEIGLFCWVAEYLECQCLCGAQVAPAFLLLPSKIEITN